MTKFLTPQEELVMIKVWKLGEGTAKEILELYKAPKPAYNTVSTFIRILEKKKYLKHKKGGRGYVYQPRVSRDEYRELLLEHLLEYYFDKDVQALSTAVMKKNSIDNL